MTSIEALGYLAGVGTTIAFWPQVWQTFRTRNVSGISLPTYIILTTGMLLWCVYGWLTNAWPIVIANFISASMAGSILVMRLTWCKIASNARPVQTRRH